MNESFTWTSHVFRINKSYLLNESCLLWMSHAFWMRNVFWMRRIHGCVYMNELCLSYEWVISFEWVMSFVNEPCLLNEPCRLNASDSWLCIHVCKSYVFRMDESYLLNEYIYMYVFARCMRYRIICVYAWICRIICVYTCMHLCDIWGVDSLLYIHVYICTMYEV